MPGGGPVLDTATEPVPGCQGAAGTGREPRSAWGSLRQGTGRQEPQAGTRTQAMNVDREDELRIQAPPGAARKNSPPEIRCSREIRSWKSSGVKRKREPFVRKCHVACEEAVAGWIAESRSLGKAQMPGPESPCVPESQASPCCPNLHRLGANPRKPPRFGPLITSLHSGSTDTNLGRPGDR